MVIGACSSANWCEGIFALFGVYSIHNLLDLGYLAVEKSGTYEWIRKKINFTL